MLKGKLLVIIQFILIFLIIYFGDANGGLRGFGFFLAIFIGLWAILSMKLRVSVFPEPNHVKALTESGPYKLIRHPMYTAVLLLTLSYVNDLLTIVFWLVLLADLTIKMQYEEELLSKKFKNYSNYRLKTKKLIPYIY